MAACPEPPSPAGTRSCASVTGELRLRDLDSHNGLFVNGERCAEAALREGDVVRLGEWVGVVAPLAAASGPVPVPRPGALAASLHLGPTALQVALRAHRLASTTPGGGAGGRDRYRQGAVRPGHPRLVGAPGPAGGHQLRGAARVAGRGGAVRLPGGGVHRGDPFQHRPLPGGPWRNAVSRRGDRHAAGGAGQAAAGAGAERGVAASASRGRCRSMSGSSPPPRCRWPGRWRTSGCAPTCTPGWTASPCGCRRCASGAPTFPHCSCTCWAGTGWPAPTLSPRLVEALCRYDWPLNVRELDFLAQRLALLLAGRADLPPVAPARPDPLVRIGPGAGGRCRAGQRPSRRSRLRGGRSCWPS